MKCFYHSADLDGHCSGAIVKYAQNIGMLPHRQEKFCELIGINYGDAFPWESIEPTETIYMVDFSLPIEDMGRLHATTNLIWIDHHKTALDAAKNVGVKLMGLQKEGFAGCELAWEYIFGMKKYPPTAVQLLGRYDVWDHGHEEVLPFQYGMRQFDNTHPNSEESEDIWNLVLSDDQEFLNAVIDKGITILEFADKENSKYAKSCAFEVDFMGHKCVVVNRGMTNSKVFDSIFDPEKHDIMITFVFRKGLWNFSLYSIPEKEIDCGLIAKEYGGGGHPCAAGFSNAEIPFISKPTL